MTEANHKVSLSALCGVFFRIGLLSFGGGLGAWVHRETVVLRDWMTNEEFMAGFAFSQVLPGANITNLSVYIGERLRGWVGALAATLALLSGPFVLILVLAEVSAILKNQPMFHAAMEGISVAAVGLVLNVGVVSARLFMPKIAPSLVMAAIFVAIGILRLPLFLTVLVVAPISVLLAYREIKE